MNWSGECWAVTKGQAWSSIPECESGRGFKQGRDGNGNENENENEKGTGRGMILLNMGSAKR